ncbi:CDP-glycerol glycerophosphotransferase family protein [Limosilactobacillus reuteri]|uniref:CDP-glycerol glycerophosphotransferase family protein n=1 Tax=Limosilactobacillus reuteri TaxID=1598 RepID=UPI0015820FC6|nr:CDP-glycerol glycerophosphotransferase family protein [Limosilactobacillus reuteri]QKT15266.1 CDP-glycerol glycerophosphotransferase family protein [Limosilactobacillus reuteri]
MLIKKINNKLVIPFSKVIFKNKPIIKNKIVVDNFGGKGYGDNPKYIVESLLKKKINLDIVWLVNDMSTVVPNGVRKVKYNTPSSIYELATAHVWIDNIKNSIKPHKRKGQYYIQTWHGGIGLKAVERQVEDKLSPKYVSKSKQDAEQTDLMLSDSSWTTDIFKNWFWYDGPIKKTGFPRNDILVKPLKSLKEKVYSFFKIDSKKKIILYAPTFRDNSNISAYQTNFKKIIEAANKKFNKNYVVLIRLHPNTWDELKHRNIKLYDFSDEIIKASNYPDMQELLAVSDILITDYSSCMFDGMIGKKKVFLFVNDLIEYSSYDRGLLFNIKDLPFELAFNNTDLVNKVLSFNEKKYISNVEDFEKKLRIFEDGNASDRVANLIISKCEE